MLAKLSIRKKAVEADILRNFQKQAVMLYQDGVEMQSFLSLSSKKVICEHLETLWNLFLS
jgi:hypothetical protein